MGTKYWDDFFRKNPDLKIAMEKVGDELFLSRDELFSQIPESKITVFEKAFEAFYRKNPELKRPHQKVYEKFYRYKFLDSGSLSFLKFVEKFENTDSQLTVAKAWKGVDSIYYDMININRKDDHKNIGDILNENIGDKDDHKKHDKKNIGYKSILTNNNDEEEEWTNNNDGEWIRTKDKALSFTKDKVLPFTEDKVLPFTKDKAKNIKDRAHHSLEQESVKFCHF